MSPHHIAVATLLLAGCATSRAPEAFVVIRTPVAAQLFLDDRFVGAAARTYGLRAGHHRLEIRAEGRLTAYRDVELRRGDRITLEVPLHPDPDRDDLDEPAAPAPARPAAPPSAGAPVKP